MRLFIAIDCEQLNGYFLELQNNIPNADLTLTKSFHLTLKFLGDVQTNTTEKILETLNEISYTKFSFKLDKVGHFETYGKVNVLWIGIKPEEKVIELQKEIDKKLSPYFSKEKDFKPHVTLARIKHVESKKEFLEKFNSIEIDKKEVKVNEVQLMQSTMDSNGPIYTVIGKKLLFNV